ncbi:hypothetical protein ACQCVE_01860 [Metabacillus sp. 113a]|uniref:hypothetical protein n=1 Tax=Metabacillus sp. 113a TaxID=3404706 RepID=UPI003CEE4D46
MGRGQHFNHKQKGHEPELPKHGMNVPAKNHKEAGYVIEPVASEGDRPVEIKSE